MMRRREATSSLDLDELAKKAKWGGLLAEVPELTDEEQETWEAHRRGQPTWVPSRTLEYCWDHVDSVHGDRWDRRRFRAALDRDREEIAQVIRDHPQQRNRLQRWPFVMEQLGRERAARHQGVGFFYERLVALGYSSEGKGAEHV